MTFECEFINLAVINFQAASHALSALRCAPVATDGVTWSVCLLVYCVREP